MTITLQVGKYYKDRTGRVWGPVYTNHPGWSWREDGMWLGDEESSFDLIEEVPAPQPAPAPVRLARDMTLREHIAKDLLVQLIAGPRGMNSISAVEMAVNSTDALIAALDKKESK